MLSGVLQFSGVRVILRSLRSQGNQHLFHMISPLSNIFSTYLLKRYKQSTPIYLTIYYSLLYVFHNYLTETVENYVIISGKHKKERGSQSLSNLPT